MPHYNVDYYLFRYLTQDSSNSEEEQEDIEYLLHLELSRQDFTNNVPSKQVNHFNDSYAGPGLLGYTYLGSSHIWLNDKLEFDPYKRLSVAVHEAIHTPDEYETRQLEEWMMDLKLTYNINNYKSKDNKEKEKYFQKAA